MGAIEGAESFTAGTGDLEVVVAVAVECGGDSFGEQAVVVDDQDTDDCASLLSTGISMVNTAPCPFDSAQMAPP